MWIAACCSRARPNAAGRRPGITGRAGEVVAEATARVPTNLLFFLLAELHLEEVSRLRPFAPKETLHQLLGKGHCLLPCLLQVYQALRGALGQARLSARPQALTKLPLSLTYILAIAILAIVNKNELHAGICIAMVLNLRLRTPVRLRLPLASRLPPVRSASAGSAASAAGSATFTAHQSKDAILCWPCGGVCWLAVNGALQVAHQEAKFFGGREDECITRFVGGATPLASCSTLHGPGICAWVATRAAGDMAEGARRLKSHKVLSPATGCRGHCDNNGGDGEGQHAPRHHPSLKRCEGRWWAPSPPAA
mmetsp:Transcript_59889/g.135405  ORF Transcript_59889/g.135405 Transcript_59889/m.135405 type:complete len:309 (+) Transcript_59889:790-1716(+)